MSSGKRAAETDGLSRAPNSQRSSAKSGRFKLLRNLVICTMALAFLVGCDCAEEVVKTHQEAFETLKKKVLSDPGYLKELSAVGADESIFDNVQIVPRHLAAKQNLSDYPCNRPKKYSTANGTEENAVRGYNIYIKTYEIKKANCDNCWDLVMLSALIERCSGSISRVRITRRPSWLKGMKPDGTWWKDGDEGPQCGPAFDYP